MRTIKMEKKNKIHIFKSTFVTVIMLMIATIGLAQSNGDKLFMEGQTLQQKQTISSQNQAIKKFEAAKVVYTSTDKKKMCDNQIAICNNNISSLKRASSSKGHKEKKQAVETKEVKLSLSKNSILFDGDKKGMSSIAVVAPSIEWNFKSSEGVEGEENYVKATRSSDAKSIDIEVEANPSTLERHQSFVVSYESVTDTLMVSQSGKEVTLSTNSNLVEFKLKGGSKSIELYTNSDSIISSNNGLTWYVESKPNWIETSVEVNKKKSVVGKGLSALRGLVSSKAKAATADDVKISEVTIVALALPKGDPSYSTGRKGEIVFASQDKTYRITVIQQ